MIKFSGELSSKCKKFAINKEKNNAFIGALVAIAPLIVFFTIISLTWEPIFALFVPVCILAIFMGGAKPKEKSYGLILPHTIEIDDDLLVAHGERFCETREYSQIKKIIDMGEWYDIYFYFPHKSSRFICEKQLIVEGSIEEFENQFFKYIEKRPCD